MENTAQKPSKAVLVLTVVAGAALVLGLVLIYFLTQLDGKISERAQQAQKSEAEIAEIARALQVIHKRLEGNDGQIASLRSELQVTRDRVGVTASELRRARALAQQLKEEQQRNVEALGSQIAQKANTEQVSSLEQQSQTKFQGITQDISTVKGDVQAGRQELARTKEELSKLGVLVTDQGKLIATNATGLDELRRRGEKEYFTFDVRKKQRTNLAGIAIELRKADLKNHYADLKIFVDDLAMDKKKIYTNNPLTFYGGQQRTSYELVINEVRKDEIVGYLSVPKEKILHGPPALRR